MKQTLAAAFLPLVLASSAYAQSGYIAGSLSADIGRTGSLNGTDAPGSGEAMSFSLRAGGAITPRFGVELDFTRPSEIETDETPGVGIYADVPIALTTLSTLSSLPADLSLPIIPPSIVSYKVHTAQRTTTITAAVWARQQITPRFALVYLGGVAFGRVDRTTTSSFNLPIALASIYPPSYEMRTIDYTTGPMGGFESRIGLSGHVEVVPGVRLLAVAGGWIIRPAVGIGWTF